MKENVLRVVQTLPLLLRCFAATLKAGPLFGNDSSSTFMVAYSFWRCGRLECCIWDSFADICWCQHLNHVCWCVVITVEQSGFWTLAKHGLIWHLLTGGRTALQKNSFREHVGQPNSWKIFLWNWSKVKLQEWNLLGLCPVGKYSV